MRKILLAALALTVVAPYIMAQGILDSLEVVYDKIMEGESVEQVTVKQDSQPQQHRILLFGDSMLDGVGRRFNDYAAANGHTLFTSIWYGSTTKSWAYTTELPRLMKKVDPTFVIVCLGTNDLGYHDITARSEAVQEIMREIGNVPFVWIGPVTLRSISRDPGIVNMIRQNVGTTRFYDSYDLRISRGPDGIHPTFQAAALWVDGIAHWMSSPETDYPIKMDVPRASVPFKNYETHRTSYKGKKK
jgi:lysophospholipase L1-like esterase